MLRRLLVLCAAVVSVGCDRRQSVTKQMGWECVGAEDTGNRTFPHVETIKLWFLENPRFEEHASGPSLCVDLHASGESAAAVTFDVWGNAYYGLHGYDMTGIAAGSKRLALYGSGSGGYRDPDQHYGNFSTETDKKQHPELYRFPLEVFK
jgi:hypothetical protein